MDYGRILIVDDSATARMIIKKCLEIAGLHKSEFFEAENGLDALSFLADSKVDLIVTDINMPKMDGNTLIKKLKMSETTIDIPIIIISSVGKNKIQTNLVEMGVKGIICKPISPTKIKELIG